MCSQPKIAGEAAQDFVAEAREVEKAAKCLTRTGGRTTKQRAICSGETKTLLSRQLEARDQARELASSGVVSNSSLQEPTAYCATYQYQQTPSDGWARIEGSGSSWCGVAPSLVESVSPKSSFGTERVPGSGLSLS